MRGISCIALLEGDGSATFDVISYVVYVEKNICIFIMPFSDVQDLVDRVIIHLPLMVALI